MDTSEQYIKMCEKAEEIQKLGNIRDTYYCELRQGIVFNHNDVLYVEEEAYIWLPRQDQLQEMLEENLWKLNHRYIYWLYDSEDYPGSYIKIIDGHIKHEHLDFSSMEQLWLAFVMKEKYNKIWGGEDWVND